MRKTLRFETADHLPANIAGRVHDVTEEETTRRPEPGRDVYHAAALFGRAAFLLVIGVFAIAIILIHLSYVLNREQTFLLIGLALGFAAFVSAAVYLVVLRSQLRWYQAQIVRRRRYGLNAIDGPGRREFNRLAANPAVLRVGKYTKWTEKKKRALGRRLVDDQGRWIGGERFTRKHIEGIIENYTENWPLIRDDFENWGWTADQLFTAYGRTRVTVWATDPPAPRSAS